MVEVVRTLRGFFNPNILVENVILFSILSIFLAMYGPRLHIRLPSTLHGLFDNPVFRGTVLFLVAYIANRDFVGALVISVVFLVTINLLQGVDALDSIRNLVQRAPTPSEETVEQFSPNGPPVANCGTYTTNANKIGTMYYPLNDNSNAQEMRGGNQGAESLSGSFVFY